MGSDRTIARNCNSCGYVYQAVARRVPLGWSLCCSKSCANRLRKIPKRRRVDSLYVKLDSRSQLKKMVRTLALHQCQHCGKSTNENGRNLDVHRIKPDGLGGKYELKNLVALCRSCHAKADRAILG